MASTTLAVMLAAALAAIANTPGRNMGHRGTFGGTAPATQTRPIPANIIAIGRGWYCDPGYRKFAGKCVKVPENAHTTMLLWACDSGYKRVGNVCQKVDIPDDAFPIGSEWACNFGFRRQEEQCVPMSEDERQREVGRLRALAPPGTDMTPEVLWKLWAVGGLRTADRSSWTPSVRVGMYDFSLAEVEMRCRVYPTSEEYGTLVCSVPPASRPQELVRLQGFQMAMRSCGVHPRGATGAELVCADPQLAVVQARCRATRSGSIRCR